jgi:predicted ATPase
MQISHQQKEFVMNSEKLDIRQTIGIPLSADHGRSAQIELFQKFLDAEQAGRAVTFTQTSSGLKLEVYKESGWRDYDEDERQVRTNLIRRSLIILREKIGYLVATKGCTFLG